MGRIKIAESDFHVAKAESGHITGGIQLNDNGDWVPALNKEFAIRETLFGLSSRSMMLLTIMRLKSKHRTILTSQTQTR